MKISFFFLKAIKIAGSAQKTGSVGLAETQFFFRPYLELGEIPNNVNWSGCMRLSLDIIPF